MLNDFCKGFGYVFNGVKIFYSMPGLWRYSIFPLGIIFLLYVLAIGGSVTVAVKIAGGAAWIENLSPVWKCSLVGGIILLFLVLLILLLKPLYEMTTGLFWERLTEKFEFLHYGKKMESLSWKISLRQNADCAVYGIFSLLWFLLLFVIGFFIPIIGPAVLFSVMAYRYGISCLFCTTNNRGTSVRECCAVAGKRRWLILGYGIASYLLLLIPFGAIFSLPGIIVGGTLLFHGELESNGNSENNSVNRRNMV